MLFEILLLLSNNWNFNKSIKVTTTQNSYNSAKLNFFATTVDGLEKTLSNEIKSISDAKNIEISKCGVKFKGSVFTGMNCLMNLRTSLRLMEKISESNGIDKREELYDFCSSINWSKYLTIDNTFKCEVTLGQSSTDLSHSHFSSLTLKNAIIDQFRNKINDRPTVDTELPDLSLFLYLHRGTAILYRVWSGDESMHKRGYREVVHKAALRSTTAAAL
jgi:23S rRNA G2445 N2-methylase RlmL